MRKRTILTIAALLAASSMMAYDYEVDGIYYNQVYPFDYKVHVTYKEYEGADKVQTTYTGDVVIPDTIVLEGVKYAVTGIDEYAFAGCTGMTSITIPKGVLGIGRYAFARCSGLTSVVLPENLLGLEDMAFARCVNLKTINIPDPIQTLYGNIFDLCTSLESIHIPKNVRDMDNIFFGCSGLKSITVDPENTVYSSPNNCNAIIETAKNALIIGCKNTVIPEGVKVIGDYAFDFCTGLQAVTLPESLKRINNSAFYGCENLSSINIPAGVEQIGIEAFSCCPGLTSITVDPANTVFDSRNGCNAMIYSQSNMLLYGCKNTVIPDDIESIGDGAFLGCPLTTVTIPSGVRYIGPQAFLACSDLKSVTLPEKLEEIDNAAFCICTSLTSVTIPKSVRRIGYSAFANDTSLVSVTVPESVEEIGGDAFFGTPWLKKQPDGLIYIGKSAYMYKGDMPANTRLTIKDGTREICAFTFDSCVNLVSITLPNSIVNIGDHAFKNCDRLESADLPANLKQIGYEAFYGCSSLKSVFIPEGTEYIGQSAFSGCTGIKELSVPSSIDLRGCGWIFSRSYDPNFVFYGCCNIETLYWNLGIPPFVVEICRDSLKSIYLGRGFNTPYDAVQYYSFTGLSLCPNLRSIYTCYGEPLHGLIPLEAFSNDAFNNAVLYVPEGCEDNFKAERPWAYFRNLSHLTDNPLENKVDGVCYHITSYAYKTAAVVYGNYSGDVVIPNEVVINGMTYSVNEISDDAFMNSPELISLTVAKSISQIKNEQFKHCPALTKVVFQGNTEIGKNAFAYCPDITEVYCQSIVPGELLFFNPYVRGEFDEVMHLSGTKSSIYNGVLKRDITMISGRGLKLDVSNIPMGKYKLSFGILPSPDSIPNRVHPVISGFLDDNTEKVLFDSVRITKDPRGRPRTVSYMVGNDDVFREDVVTIDIGGIDMETIVYTLIGGYDTVTIIDTLVVDADYKKLTVSLSSGGETKMLFDRLFIEPLDREISESCFGPFAESVFNNATLHVQESVIDAYRNASGWKLFKNIAVDTAVEPVHMLPRENASKTIYDIMGRKVNAADLNDLPAGLYIFGGKKYIIL